MNIDDRYSGEFHNNRRLQQLFTFAIPNVSSINQMLSISYGSDNENIIGMFVQVDDYVWINCTGKNGSINDWHRIESVDDFVVVKIIRQLHNINDLIDINVKFRFDKNLKIEVEEKDPKDLDLVVKDKPEDFYHILAPSNQKVPV